MWVFLPDLCEPKVVACGSNPKKKKEKDICLESDNKTEARRGFWADCYTPPNM
jgi:hypothetical protein